MSIAMKSRFVAAQSSRYAAAAVSVSLLLFGCNKAPLASDELDPHLAVLTQLYVDHLNRKGGQPPENKQAFEAFIRERGTDRLKDVEMKDLSELFVSTRDKLPLVVFYGNASDPRLQGSVVAHEQTGIAGKRCVGMRYGTVQLVDEGEFKSLVTNTP